MRKQKTVARYLVHMLTRMWWRRPPGDSEVWLYSLLRWKVVSWWLLPLQQVVVLLKYFFRLWATVDAFGWRSLVNAVSRTPATPVALRRLWSWERTSGCLDAVIGFNPTFKARWLVVGWPGGRNHNMPPRFHDYGFAASVREKPTNTDLRFFSSQFSCEQRK